MDKPSRSKSGCIVSGCVGSTIGGGTGCLLPIVGFIYLVVSDPNGDAGGPLFWPIAAMFLAFIGATVGGVIGAVVGIIRSSGAKKQRGNEPPIAKP